MENCRSKITYLRIIENGIRKDGITIAVDCICAVVSTENNKPSSIYGFTKHINVVDDTFKDNLFPTIIPF